MSAVLAEPNTLLEYAQRYIEAGWAVLPLHGISKGRCTCGKAECASPGKHPRIIWPDFERGVQDATLDLDIFARAVSLYPGQCNIGIRPPSDVLVLDVDPRNGGEDTLEQLEQRHGRLPETVEQLSGGGGRHIALRLPQNMRPKSAKLGAGLDVKTVTGYIVAEPSTHSSGRQYGWEASSSLLFRSPQIADAPTWLLAASPTSPTSATPSAPRTLHGASLSPLRRERVRQALAFIPSDDRDEWVRFAHALKPYAEGRDLWLEWSAKSEKFDQGDAERVWASIHSRGDVRVETIFKRAISCGWHGQALSGELEEPTTAVALSAPRLQRAEVDFGQLRAVRWVIDGFIASGEVHTFAGQPGVGKTTLLAAIALVVAGYARELGSNVPNDRPRRVVIVSEHVGQFETLLFGFAKRYGLPVEELKQRVVLYNATRLPIDVLQEEIVRVIKENASAGDERPLVILDTASASFDLQDENSNAEVGGMLAELKHAVAATGAPVWVITHAAKALGRHDSEITPRGASAFIGDVHGTGSVFRDPNLPSWVFLRSLKNRAVRRFEEIAMETFIDWHTTLDERGLEQEVGIRLGVPVTSGETNRQAAAARNIEAAKTVEGFALKVKAEALVRELIEQHGRVAIWSGSGPRWRPESVHPSWAITNELVKARLGKGSKVAGEIVQHLREWIEAGALEVEISGAWWILREFPVIPEQSSKIPEQSSAIPRNPQ